MIGRIVEIADDNRHLSLQRGFMVVTDTSPHAKKWDKFPLMIFTQSSPMRMA